MIKKKLKDVDLSKETAYIDTFIGRLKIDSIDRNTWWVRAGGRSWSASPDKEVYVEVKKKELPPELEKEEKIKEGEIIEDET